MNEDDKRVISEDTSLARRRRRYFLIRLTAVWKSVRDGIARADQSGSDVTESGTSVGENMSRGFDPSLTGDSWAFHRSDDQMDAEEQDLPSPEISSFSDQNAKTIPPDRDFLNVARIFLDTRTGAFSVLDEPAAWSGKSADATCFTKPTISWRSRRRNVRDRRCCISAHSSSAKKRQFGRVEGLGSRVEGFVFNQAKRRSLGEVDRTSCNRKGAQICRFSTLDSQL